VLDRFAPHHAAGAAQQQFDQRAFAGQQQQRSAPAFEVPIRTPGKPIFSNFNIYQSRRLAGFRSDADPQQACLDRPRTMPVSSVALLSPDHVIGLLEGCLGALNGGG
jgi:hypothetical protein